MHLKKHKIPLISILLIVAVIITTPVYARFLTNVINENESMKISADVGVLMDNFSEDFINTANGKQFSFTMTNENSQGEIADDEQVCKVWVITSLGMTSEAKLTMSVAGEEYSTFPDLVDDDEFGLGYVYKFYDDNNQEINFVLPAGISTSEIIIIDIENLLEDALVEVKIVQD